MPYNSEYALTLNEITLCKRDARPRIVVSLRLPSEFDTCFWGQEKGSGVNFPDL